jgi:hypothetical protein
MKEAEIGTRPRKPNGKGYSETPLEAMTSMTFGLEVPERKLRRHRPRKWQTEVRVYVAPSGSGRR